MRFSVLLLVTACGAAVPSANPAAVDLKKPNDVVTANTNAPSGPPENDVVVPIEAADATWGSRKAPVTIVEFSDFQCPYCGRAQQAINQIKTTYGPEKVRLVFKHAPLPFHPNARPAADAAATIRGLGGDKAFWYFHDLAFQNQDQLSPAKYEAWAEVGGVNLTAYREALKSGRFIVSVDRDLETGKKIGVNGTPAFFVNGVPIDGAQPFDKFKTVIDEQLTRAKSAVDTGTAPEAIYRTLTTANYKPPSADDDDESEKPDLTVWNIPIGTSPVLGSPAALVTIVEFSDFQCPYCKRVEPTLASVRAAYGNKVRLVWKHEPLAFHPRANPAALFAIEARAEKGDQGFWNAHDALFGSQPALEDADFDAIAAKLGLNVTKVHAAIAQKKSQTIIDNDVELADDVAATGTPHFFINGRRLVGAQPEEKFKALIDEEMKKAEALVTAGTKPENVYAETMKTGKAPPPPATKTIALKSGAPVLGPATAPVTIAIFSDFQCPFCKRAEATLAEIRKNYPKNVKFEWHNMPLPFHAHAHPAAEAGVAVFKLKGNAAFWLFHDAAFASQGDGGAGLEDSDLETMAKAAGADLAKFKAAMTSRTYAADVDADAKTGSDAGVSGTPSFVISSSKSPAGTGYFVNGAQPYSKFHKVIELALAESAAGKKP